MNRPAASRIRWRWVAAGLVATLVVAVGVFEALGWPFLAGPLQRGLSSALNRPIGLGAAPGEPAHASIRLLGGIRVSAPTFEIGAPEWSKAPYMLRARDATVRLGYLDLWRAHRGQRLRIRDLRADTLDVRLERRDDGRATWQFGKPKPPDEQNPAQPPDFGRLSVDAGTLDYHDAVLAVDLDATFSLVDASDAARRAVAMPSSDGASTTASQSKPDSKAESSKAESDSKPAQAAAAAPEAAASVPVGLQFNAKGTYRKQPLRIDLHTPGVLPAFASDAATVELPVVLDGRVGGARVSFRGTATDVLHFAALKGRFSLQGPSLAAVGDPLGVTLPTTSAFRTDGLIAKRGEVWNAVFERATIGSSRLSGSFTYDPRPKVPLLAGRLSGPRLLLADLGPAVGLAPRTEAEIRAAEARRKSEAARKEARRRSAAARGRVLPDREFDLPSLRAMDANVLVDIDSLDLGSEVLAPLRPLRTHLVLKDAVLTLNDIDARTAKGRLAGRIQLDGREPTALWDANLRWDDVHLETWIRQARKDDAPPYITGRLYGQARVAGQGKSTASILGTLHGGVQMRLANGAISHLAVEAAGLDIAQGLGMLIKGDEALPIECTVADLVADKGVLKSRVVVVDTRDSTMWVDGTVSLASEALDLRVIVAPKDFSPMALRAPLHVGGTFSDPSVSLDGGDLGKRLGASALLALINPIAALIPLIDTGSGDKAQRDADACHALAQRIGTRPHLPPPGAAKRKPAPRQR